MIYGFVKNMICLIKNVIYCIYKFILQTFILGRYLKFSHDIQSKFGKLQQYWVTLKAKAAFSDCRQMGLLCFNKAENQLTLFAVTQCTLVRHRHILTFYLVIKGPTSH